MAKFAQAITSSAIVAAVLRSDCGVCLCD